MDQYLLLMRNKGFMTGFKHVYFKVNGNMKHFTRENFTF